MLFFKTFFQLKINFCLMSVLPCRLRVDAQSRCRWHWTWARERSSFPPGHQGFPNQNLSIKNHKKMKVTLVFQIKSLKTFILHAVWTGLPCPVFRYQRKKEKMVTHRVFEVQSIKKIILDETIGEKPDFPWEPGILNKTWYINKIYLIWRTEKLSSRPIKPRFPKTKKIIIVR